MPIHWASRSGAVEMMRFLIKMGSSPTSCMEGRGRQSMHCLLHISYDIIIIASLTLTQ